MTVAKIIKLYTSLTAHLNPNFISLHEEELIDCYSSICFFIACTLLYTLLCWSVLLLVHPLVNPVVCHISFPVFMRSLTLLLLPKYFTDLKYYPCPATDDWSSRVSGLVSDIPNYHSHLFDKSDKLLDEDHGILKAFFSDACT